MLSIADVSDFVELLFHRFVMAFDFRIITQFMVLMLFSFQRKFSEQMQSLDRLDRVCFLYSKSSELMFFIFCVIRLVKA